MKITAIEPILIKLPYEHGAPKPPMGAGPVRETMDALLLRVETDKGITGWGEAFGFATTPVTISAIENALTPLVIGQDVDDIEKLTTTIKRKMQNMMHGGPARFAVSALDIALWDIRGKAMGEPVWKLLNDKATRDYVPAYASLLKLGEPERVSKICDAALERGYRHIKLHERTVEATNAAREAIGPDVSLMVDTNCAWTVDEAIAMAQQMRPLNLTWLEEPISPPDDYAGLARVRCEGGVPVAVGENLGNPMDVHWLAGENAADFIQPSVVKLGGISDVWKTQAYAKTKGIRVMPHSPFVGPGLIATIHIVAAMEDDVWCEHRYCDLGADPLKGTAPFVDGNLMVPQKPGLGIEMDMVIVERYRTKP